MADPAAFEFGAAEKTLHVLILSQHYWPESFRINDVAKSLVDTGCRVTVLTGQPNYPMGKVFDGYGAWQTSSEMHDGVCIHRVPLVPRGKGGALRMVANYLSFIASASLVGAWRLRRQRFDVIFVYGTSPILQAVAGVALSRIKHCALVTWVQDLWPESLKVTGYVHNPTALRAVAKVVSWIYSKCHLLLVQSEAFIEPVRQLCKTVPIRFHPNPGDRDARDAPNRAALNLPAGFNIVFAGNLGTAQALDTVISAAQLLADLDDVRIVLIGSGQRSAWLLNQIAERGLKNVLLPGRFEPVDMPAIFAQASALLVTLALDPTVGKTIPSKLQSYLAAGRPVLAAVPGEGARIVKESGAGLCCAPEDSVALATAIRALRALSQTDRDAMGRAGRDYYEAHYAPSLLTGQLIDHLNAAIADRRRPLRQ